MSRGVSKELENEIRKTLGQLIDAEPGSFISVSFGSDPLEIDALHYLADIGAFQQTGTGSHRLTAQGRDHWEKLNAPRWYWFRQNWFPASVAAGTILFSAAAAAANIVNLVK